MSQRQRERRQRVHTVAEIRKLIGTKDTYARPGKLFLAEHDGKVWATNSHWLVPATSVEPILHKFNLGIVPGCHEVTGSSVTRTKQDPPNVAPLFPRFDETVEMERVQVDGRDAYTRAGNGFVELWRNGETMVALNWKYAAWLKDQRPKETREARFGEVKLYQAKATDPTVGWCEREKRDGDKWVASGRECVGLLMSFRMG